MKPHAIIEKAKNTPYHHPAWFREGVTVFEAMKYFANYQDCSIELKTNIKYASQIPGAPSNNYREIVNYCLDNIETHWKYIRIKAEGGSDTGKLKMQTYCILKNLQRN